MEFLYEYGMFLAKAVTIIVTVGVIIGLIVSAGQKNKSSATGTIKVTPLNEQYDEVKEHLQSAILEDEVLKQMHKADKKQKKAEKKAQKKLAKEHAKKSAQDDVQQEDTQTSAEDAKKRMYVIDFDGDIKASAVASLREEITAILSLRTING